MTVDQSMSPGSAGEARGRRTDLAPLRSEWQAVHGELSTVVEAILAQIFATASRQAVEVLARLEREGTDLLGDLEARRSAASSA
jgi:ribose 1,5-bisphosphokinase PhnN